MVLFPVYVSNTFMGSRQPFRQLLAIIMGAVAITMAILASMASVALFFAATSRGYHFIKLLHVLFFIYACLTGLAFLKRCLAAVCERARRTIPAGILLVWLLLYMFVGTEWAWLMRPFIASPEMPFQIVRPRSGNFYESVRDSLSRMISGKDE